MCSFKKAIYCKFLIDEGMHLIQLKRYCWSIEKRRGGKGWGRRDKEEWRKRITSHVIKYAGKLFAKNMCAKAYVYPFPFVNYEKYKKFTMESVCITFDSISNFTIFLLFLFFSFPPRFSPPPHISPSFNHFTITLKPHNE